MTAGPIAEVGEDGNGRSLPRSLGRIDITAIGIGAIIGAGIFIVTGTAAAQYAGPGIILSFILGGIACGFVGLCYAELAAALPVSGSTYTYVQATLGELAAWIIGWDLILEYATGAATVAAGWSAYLVSLLHDLGLVMPSRIAQATGSAITLADGRGGHALLDAPAAAIVLLLTLLLIGGMRQSARLNTVMVACKLTVVLGFVAIGAFFVHGRNWLPLIPANTGHFGQFGASGILRGAGVVFYAYIGFEIVATAAQEARHPQRDMPIGILASLLICTALYVAVAAVLTGIVPYVRLNVADPIGIATETIGLAWFSLAIKLGILIGLTTVMLVFLFGLSRVVYAMARDGLLPSVFARLHPRTGTPHVSHLLIGGCVAAVAAFIPIAVLGEIISIGTLLAFTLVCVAVIRLRRTAPHMERPFRTPAMPWTPGLGIVCCLTLIGGLQLGTWVRLIAWLAIGLALYLVYGRGHAVQHRRRIS